jgi:protein-disulfide isomerase
MRRPEIPSSRDRSQIAKIVLVLLSGWLGLAACSSSQSGPKAACPLAVNDSPVRGADDAWVTIIEFEDFQCPACGAAQPTLREIDVQRPGVVRWVFKHLPWSYHEHALSAAIAAECAHEQQLFWPMHDLLYKHQDALNGADLARCAAQVGLDLAVWNGCLTSNPPRQRIEADIQQAEDGGVDATPTFFINGTPLVGAQPLEDFLTSIDQARSTAESSGVAAADYYSTLETHGCR